jgi:hypothetical protein
MATIQTFTTRTKVAPPNVGSWNVVLMGLWKLYNFMEVIQHGYHTKSKSTSVLSFLLDGDNKPCKILCVNLTSRYKSCIKCYFVMLFQTWHLQSSEDVSDNFTVMVWRMWVVETMKINGSLTSVITLSLLHLSVSTSGHSCCWFCWWPV